jgi:S-DNA-T family DNA segregation ATPase FtsK/SpoIIIE
MYFSIPAGLSLDDFMNKQEEFSQYLRGEVHFSYDEDKGEILMMVYNAKLPSKIMYDKVIRPKGTIDLLIGVSRQGPLFVSLKDEAPHVLIAGYTGSGKSVLLRVLIVNLILSYKPEQIRLHLIDLKGGLEFYILNGSCYVESFASTVEQGKSVLKKLKNEMYRRMELMRQSRSVKIDNYNKNHKPLSRHIIIIDEFPNMGRDKEAEELLDELLRLARAEGIHIIACMQDPRVKNLSGELKGNFGATIALKVRGKTQSQIILDCDRAAKLKGNGHGICRVIDDTEFQGYFLSEDKAVELIEHTIVENMEDKENTEGVVSIYDYTKGSGDN